jgi:sec-independent protein translocase protein TatB
LFGVDSSELAVVAILALIFIGPKDLPKVMRTVGYWVGRVRGMARHFTAGIENMVREAELEEMEKRWREENERILKLHPANAHYPEPVTPQPTEPQAGEPDEMPPIAEVIEPKLPFNEEQKGDELPPEERPLP